MKPPHPVFRWVWAVWSLHLLAAVWLYPALVPAEAALLNLSVTWWLRLSVLLLFGAFEFWAKLANDPRFRETLSEIVTWVHRKLSKNADEEPWDGWNGLLFSPFVAHVGWVYGLTLYQVLRLAVTVWPAALFAVGTGGFLMYGLFRHWTAPQKVG